MWTTIKTLKEQGKNKAQIAKITGHDWKTVNKIIQQIDSGQEKPLAQERGGKLMGYKEEILKLLGQGLSGVRIHEELQTKGYSGSYQGVKKYINKLKRKEKIFVRIHTEPGKEAQVDFGYVGRTPDNNDKLRKTWVFNMRLSYSRLDYYEKVYNQKVETFIQCHINAFD